MCMYFDSFKQKIRNQGNLGLKISRFSCMTQPQEIADKSGTNGPTVTKFGSYVANVYFEH